MHNGDRLGSTSAPSPSAMAMAGQQNGADLGTILGVQPLRKKLIGRLIHLLEGNPAEDSPNVMPPPPSARPELPKWNHEVDGPGAYQPFLKVALKPFLIVTAIFLVMIFWLGVIYVVHHKESKPLVQGEEWQQQMIGGRQQADGTVMGQSANTAPSPGFGSPINPESLPLPDAPAAQPVQPVQQAQQAAEQQMSSSLSGAMQQANALPAQFYSQAAAAQQQLQAQAVQQYQSQTGMLAPGMMPAAAPGAGMAATAAMNNPFMQPLQAPAMQAAPNQQNFVQAQSSNFLRPQHPPRMRVVVSR